MTGIRVYARIRPPSLKTGKGSKRNGDDSSSQWLKQENEQQVSIESGNGQRSIPPSRAGGSRTATPSSGSGRPAKNRTFQFERVLSVRASQEEVFDVVAKSIVERCVEGFNGTIFAYGVTGSGKTYTVEGSCRKYAERGLIARTLTHLYERLSAREGIDWSVHISYLEIYQDTGYDLLNPGARGHSMMATLPKVAISQQGESVIIRNLSSHLAANEEVALNLHFQGQANRRIAETPLNQRSSRSHAIFTITVTAQEADSEVVTRSKLHLVDLAGSERVSKSGVRGQQLSEAKHINLSLHHLEHVIVMLHRQSKDAAAVSDEPSSSSGSLRRRSRSTSGASVPPTRGSMRSQGGHREEFGHVPYRNSLLTMVLRDSLGGNCHTAMVATLVQTDGGQGEALSTCTFAQRVACITNTVRRNEDLDDKAVIRKLKLRVAELEAEVERYRARLTNPAILGNEAAAAPASSLDIALTADEKELCMRVMKQFLMGEISDPVAAGIDDVRKFRQCMQFLQLLIRTKATRSVQSPRSSNTSQPALVSSNELRTSHPNSTGQQQPTKLPLDQEQQVGEAVSRPTLHPGGGKPGIARTAWGTSDQSHSTVTLERNVTAHPGLTGETAAGAVAAAERNPRAAQLNDPALHMTPDQTSNLFVTPSGPKIRAAEHQQQLSPVIAAAGSLFSQPNSPRSPKSPASPATSPRSKHTSPKVSPSSLHETSPRNQKPVFATVFEQQRAREIERRSQRLLEVQNVQEHKQQHLILSQLILLENEHRLHLESLSEALAAQHARVKALARRDPLQSDIRQEQLAEQALHRRQVEAHRKLQLIQEHLNLYREKIAAESRKGAANTSPPRTHHPEEAMQSAQEVSRHHRKQQQRLHKQSAGMTREEGTPRSTAVAAADGGAVGERNSKQSASGSFPRNPDTPGTNGAMAAGVQSSSSGAAQSPGKVPATVTAVALAAAATTGAPAATTGAPAATTGAPAATTGAPAATTGTPAGAHITVTPRTDARKVMKALMHEEAKQREIHVHMENMAQNQVEEELAAKERATRLKLQQFRAMLQGQSLVPQQPTSHRQAGAAGHAATSTPSTSEHTPAKSSHQHTEVTSGNGASDQDRFRVYLNQPVSVDSPAKQPSHQASSAVSATVATAPQKPVVTRDQQVHNPKHAWTGTRNPEHSGLERTPSHAHPERSSQETMVSSHSRHKSRQQVEVISATSVATTAPQTTDESQNGQQRSHVAQETDVPVRASSHGGKASHHRSHNKKEKRQRHAQISSQADPADVAAAAAATRHEQSDVQSTNQGAVNTANLSAALRQRTYRQPSYDVWPQQNTVKELDKQAGDMRKQNSNGASNNSTPSHLPESEQHRLVGSGTSKPSLSLHNPDQSRHTRAGGRRDQTSIAHISTEQTSTAQHTVVKASAATSPRNSPRSVAALDMEAQAKPTASSTAGHSTHLVRSNIDRVGGNLSTEHHHTSEAFTGQQERSSSTAVSEPRTPSTIEPTSRGRQSTHAHVSKEETGKTPTGQRQSGSKDLEKKFMTAAQRQRERVDRIRKAQQAASVIQRAWRKHHRGRRT